jgi:hypothetical protein
MTVQPSASHWTLVAELPGVMEWTPAAKLPPFTAFTSRQSRAMKAGGGEVGHPFPSPMRETCRILIYC